MDFYDVEFALLNSGQSGRATVLADSVKRARELVEERLIAAGFKTHEDDVYDIIYIDLAPPKEGAILIGVI